MKEVQCFNYNLITADLDYGVREHPEKQMRELGYKITRGLPVPMGDCWIFEVEKDDSITPPPYLYPVRNDFFSDTEDPYIISFKERKEAKE